MKKIFIVDQNINFLHALQVNLNLRGFQTTVFYLNEPAENIHQQIKIQQPHVLVTDIYPANGYKLINLIKSNPETANLPVFIFSSLADDESKNHSINLGADYFFSKNDLPTDEFINRFEKIIINKNLI